MGLTVFLLKLGSRRQVGFELASPTAPENLNRLSGCHQEALAHGDTLNHFLGHVHPREWSILRRKMVQRLIRTKALDRGKLLGHFLIVVDGTGQLHFSRRHCDHCLEQKHEGGVRYYHHVLEAKLVTPEGLAISIGSEFIENADPRATKQDCELKAFYRLAQRLKKDFPQLRLCLLLDGLYAKGPVLKICRDNHWKYIITFQEGSLPALWKEYESLRQQCPQNRLERANEDGILQRFAWVEQLEHVDEEGHIHRLGALECTEPDAKGKPHRFAWITNFTVSSQTVRILANRGGRCRWKIENEGFNIQKNGGFDLEHAYSLGDWQLKGFYLLLQIAPLILQLVERGNLLGQDCRPEPIRTTRPRYYPTSLETAGVGPDSMPIALPRWARFRCRFPVTGLQNNPSADTMLQTRRPCSFPCALRKHKEIASPRCVNYLRTGTQSEEQPSINWTFAKSH